MSGSIYGIDNMRGGFRGYDADWLEQAIERKENPPEIDRAEQDKKNALVHTLIDLTSIDTFYAWSNKVDLSSMTAQEAIRELERKLDEFDSYVKIGE